jgi:ligand-binding sensor domain-containing protein
MVLLVQLSHYATAQTGQLLFRHISRSAGLPVDQVTSIAQDSSGFIWIGSTEGLFRYDGFSFKAFYAEPGNSKTLPENIITKIFVSSKGLIWIGTKGGGICCMQKDGRIFQTFNTANTSSITSLGNHITEIKEDKKGNIWWSSVDGIFKLSPNAKKPECYKIKSSNVRDNLFNSLLIDGGGNILLAGYIGLRIFNPVSKTFTLLKGYEQRKDISKFILHHNNLWYSSWVPDLVVFDTAKKEHKLLYSGLGTTQPDFNRMSNAFYTDKKGNLWIATGKGLHFINRNEKRITLSYNNEPGNNHSIISDDVQCLLEDKEGNFWIGTKEGISITQPYSHKLVNLSTNSSKTTPFGDKTVKHIIEVDKNTFLIATHHADGVYETDSTFKVRKHFSFNDVKYDWVWHYYDDKLRNRIWISTQEGMLIYDKRTHTLKKSSEPLFNQRNTVSAFIATSDSILWMTRFRNYLIRYNLNTGSYREYSITDLGEQPQVLYLAKDTSNSLWIIAHSAGLLKFDEKEKKILEKLTAKGTEQSLQQNNINFFEDAGNQFIIGYNTKGISLYDKTTKQYHHLTQANGLASNSTKAAFVANADEVWIATNNGISKLTISNRSFRNYGYNQGIINNEFISITKTSAGKIVAGSTKGMVVFDPAEMNKTATPTPPIISEINVYGKRTDAAHPLQISYKENYFSIEYLSLQYNNNSDIEYAYKLEGLDKDWVMAGKRRFASYSNINGGKYFFKVKARRPGEEWVESSTALPIIVTSPFYTQWWFFVLSILILAALVYILFRYRVQQVLQLERMRTTISSDLHDEVGASLTSISIFSEMARKSLTPASKEEQYLQRIGDRSRESIEKMGDIIWSINPDNDSLQQMLVRMKNYATEITEASDVAVHWKESGNLTASRLSMEQRKNIYLLFKEVINNSIKHAAAENIWIELASTSNTINITISDDGKGFNQQSATYGNGIKSMQRRAGALKGKLIINSAPQKGTSVHLNFRY